MAIIRLYPTSETLNTNMGAIGAPSTYEACDDSFNAPRDGDYAYITSAVANGKIRFGFEDLPASLNNAVIRSVTPRMRFVWDAGVGSGSAPPTWSRDWNPHVFSGGVEYDGTTRSGATDVSYPAIESDTRRTTDPNTGLPWTVAGVNAYQAGIESTTVTADILLLSSFYLEVEYDTLPGEHDRQREHGSRRLRTYRRPRQLLQVGAPLHLGKVDLLGDVRVAHPRAPSADGRGWPVTDPRLHRVLEWTLDPEPLINPESKAPPIHLTMLDLRADVALVLHWETYTKVSPGLMALGVARISRGGTRTLTRATRKWAEDPGDHDAGSIRVIEVPSGYEAWDQRGLLIEAAGTNVVPHSSFVSGIATGLTTTGTVAADTSDVMFDTSITPSSAELTGDGATTPMVRFDNVPITAAKHAISLDYKCDTGHASTWRVQYVHTGTGVTWYWDHGAQAWTTTTTNNSMTNSSSKTRQQFVVDFSTAAGLAAVCYVSFRGSSTLGRIWHVYHCQVQTGLYATSRIVTNGGSVTRNADVLTLAQPAGKQILLVAGHAGYLEFVPGWNTADLTTNRTLFHCSMDANNSFQLRYAVSTGEFQYIVKSAGVDYSAVKAHTVVRDTPIAISFCLAPDGTVSIGVNGSEGTSAAGALPTETVGSDLYLGSTNGPAQQCDGALRQILITPFPLTSTERARLP